jgi:predicted O-methyltransferase YrrM
VPYASRLAVDLLLFGIAAAGSYLVLRLDLGRRKLPASALAMATICTVAGAIALAAVSHIILDMPETRLLWAGVCAAGLAACVLLSAQIAREHHVATLSALDGCSCATAVGYAVFACGFSLVEEPPSLTAFINAAAGLLIAAYLWQRGKQAIRRPLGPGVITGEFVALIGFTCALAETVHLDVQAALNPSVGALVALLIAACGIALAILSSRRFRATDQVHRILRHANVYGSELQAEYHRPTPECPHPERWRMFDSMTAEVEVLEFLRTLVTTTKPDLVVETGTFLGVSTLYLAEGLRQNGFGRVITCEPDAEAFSAAQTRFTESGLGDWIDSRPVSSLDLEVSEPIDVLFSDSLPELREQEVRRFLPCMKPGGLVLIHDASSHLKTVREAALKLEREGLISVVLLPTPRGLAVGQKRQR